VCMKEKEREKKRKRERLNYIYKIEILKIMISFRNGKMNLNLVEKYVNKVIRSSSISKILYICSFQVEHFRNSTRARLLLERVRSPEGSAGEFHAGRRVFWESALRHLRSHYPYPFPCRSESFSLSFTFSIFFLLPHYSALAAANRGAKDGFWYRKDRE